MVSEPWFFNGETWFPTYVSQTYLFNLRPPNLKSMLFSMIFRYIHLTNKTLLTKIAYN